MLGDLLFDNLGFPAVDFVVCRYLGVWFFGCLLFRMIDVGFTV